MPYPYLLHPAVGFCSEPLPSGDGYTWSWPSILGTLLAESEERFGARNAGWTPLGIEFCGDIPHLWYPGNRGHIAIILTAKAAFEPARALFQLAHEVIHLLAPTGHRGAPVVEEGLASIFAEEVTAREGHPFHSSGAYVDAARTTGELLAIDKDAIRRIRRVEPSFTKFHPALIREVLPSVPAALAEALCQPFLRDPMPRA